ncbi:MAG: DctP family TRAP transporter solute-binding subunit [Lachnospiraceae bacterium]|nr:DctP family TRAP transporter solute-binding subunit [Lachnospiraceae bacterium]
MKKKFVGIVLSLVVVAGLVTGCGGKTESPSNEASNTSEETAGETSGGDEAAAEGTEGNYDTVSLRLSCNGTDMGNDTKAAKLFAEKIQEKSGGKITVTVFPNDQLAGGNMSKGLEMLCDGTVDMDVHSTSIIAALDNSLMVSTLPWLFSDYQAAEDAFYGAGGEYIDSVLQQKGVYYLGAVHNGFKAMTNSKRPIQRPEDLSGLKIRVPGGEFFSAFYEKFGASPQAMSWSEVFTALQQGTIDGHDNSLSTINSANVQEVQKYISLSRHTYEAFTFMANAQKFDTLNADTQNLIRECVEEATKEINQQIIADEDSLAEKFQKENGCELYTFTEEDIAAFKEVVQPLVDEYKGIYGEAACNAFGVE